VDKIDNVSVYWNGISNQAKLSFTVALTLPGELSTITTLQSWKNFNQDLFNNDLMQSTLCRPFDELDQRSLDNTFDLYDSVLTRIIKKHAPFKDVKDACTSNDLQASSHFITSFHIFLVKPILGLTDTAELQSVAHVFWCGASTSQNWAQIVGIGLQS